MSREAQVKTSSVQVYLDPMRFEDLTPESCLAGHEALVTRLLHNPYGPHFTPFHFRRFRILLSIPLYSSVIYNSMEDKQSVLSTSLEQTSSSNAKVPLTSIDSELPTYLTDHHGSPRQSKVGGYGEIPKDKNFFERITREMDLYINQVSLKAFISLAVPSKTTNLKNQFSDSQYNELKMFTEPLASRLTEGEMYPILVCFPNSAIS